MRFLAVALAAVALGLPARAAQFSFGALGDVPYNAAEEPQLVAMISEMNSQQLAFAIHVGDFKASHTECSDALFLQRREWFALSHHAFVYVPGDNEWTDCARSRWGSRDPLERLAKLRELFFRADETLGQAPLRVQRQTPRGFPEHLRWTVQDVVFATLNVPGWSNNSGAPQEAQPRTAALLDWMREAFRTARELGAPALVIALQANLWSGSNAYLPILATLASEAKRYHGTVLVVHGDTHRYRFDQPLVDPDSGIRVANVWRLEVFGSPFVDWVYVTVTTDGTGASFVVKRGSDVAAKGGK